MGYGHSVSNSHCGMLAPEVYVIVLNWNGWKDTTECLESVFRIDYSSYRVIVCDNASEDGSLESIKAWAEGRLDVELPEDNALRHLSSPPVPKPVAYVEYDRAQAEQGGDASDPEARLILIQTGANLGFAGGNNVGLRYALARGDFDYVWLLNNDTVVMPDALSHMVRRMAERPGAGMCGSTLLYYHEPEKAQALGGATYNKWLGITRHIGMFHPATLSVNAEYVERKMDFVVGASMLVSRPFLQDIGLMQEDYFLYFEELDWARRACGRYILAYAPGSVVYHKEGRATAATSYIVTERDRTADYLMIRNRLTITRRFFPSALPTVHLGLIATVINRIRRGQWSRLGMILKIIANRGSGIDITGNELGK